MIQFKSLLLPSISFTAKQISRNSFAAVTLTRSIFFFFYSSLIESPSEEFIFQHGTKIPRQDPYPSAKPKILQRGMQMLEMLSSEFHPRTEDFFARFQRLLREDASFRERVHSHLKFYSFFSSSTHLPFNVSLKNNTEQ